MIVSTAKGDLIFCDIRIPSRKIPIKVHKMSIPNIFLQHNKVLSVSEDLQITQTKIPKLKNTYIKESKIISLSTSTNPCKFYYISTSFEVFSWNFKENLTLLLYKNETLNPVLLFHDEKLYLTSQSEMISINLHTSKIRTEPKAFNQKFFSMILIHPDLLACAGQSNSIFLFSLNTLQLVSELVAHGQRVTCLSSYYQVMVSGSMDKTLKVWNMVDRSLLHVLHGHSKPISEVLVDKGKIFSASQDRSLRVWYVKTGELIHLIHSISGIIKFMFLTSEFLLTCNNFGVLTYWNLTTYAKVMSNSLYGPIIQFRANEDTIIYCSDSFLVTFLNPLKGKKLVITGPKEADQFKTYKYLKKILNHKSVSFNPTCDKWVIFPHILTPLHLYAYFNMPGHVRDSLQNNTSLVQSRLKLSPLSIAVSRDLESCVSSIIKLIKPKLAENPYLLNFIDDQCLIEMNWTGHDSLALFYKVFFQEVTTEALPRFIKHEVKLPIYAKSVGMIPKSQSFIQDAKKSDIGQAVVFQRSLGKLSLAMGSKPSIKLLRSIVECKNYEIFDTPFIRAYIQHKWESVKLFMWLQFLIYFSYMVYFCLYLMQIYSNVIFLVIPLILSCVLTFYEIYKAVVSGYEYFLVVWNYLDAARAMLFLVFFYQQWKEGHDSSINDDDGETDYVLLILVMVSFIKGLSYFRLFHYTRHFIHLLFQVLIDSYAFVVILAYNTVAFGFILLVAFSFQHDLGFYMSLSFQINLAINDPSEYTPTQWVVYSLGIAINNLVMMSVLISLYGETFDNVQKVAEIENTRTLADMSLEAERNIFWRRGKTRKSYLQMCSKGKWNSENDPAVEKVKSLKRIAKDNKDEIRLVKDEILDTIKKQRIRDKAKKAGIKHQDLALRLFKMLFVEFGNNRIEKEKVVKKVEKIIRVLV
jgi:WD40 repeat protein